MLTTLVPTGFTHVPALAVLCALLAASGSVAAAGPADAAGSAEEADQAALVEPFLGTWVYADEVEQAAKIEPYPVERHLLLRWHNGRLKVKTYDYLPELRTRSRESDWNGTIRDERGNVTEQTFTPMSDGSLSVGLGGTTGIGPPAARKNWWAAGTITVENGEDGPVLRFQTTRGYVPSSKGNLWQPFDRAYRLVTREIDPEFLGRRR
jgi:hypothetical protein